MADADTLLIDVSSRAETEALGVRLGALLFPGAVIALDGPLGAGKTHFTRAVCAGLGIVQPSQVTSPTFVLVHEYQARLPVFHFDAYRLAGPADLLNLGADEYFAMGGVCLIEWAERPPGGAHRASGRAVPAVHVPSYGRTTRRSVAVVRQERLKLSPSFRKTG
jgi:tRNA threonylcarbamoyladenosine biosynthesis protein TsaE